MRAQAEQFPPPPIDWNPNVPRGLSDAILRALEKDPGRRFQTAEEFLSAIAPYRKPWTVPRTAKPSVTAAPITAAGSIAGVPSAFDQEALSGLERKLVPYVGPIARHLVRKASGQAASMA